MEADGPGALRCYVLDENAVRQSVMFEAKRIDMGDGRAIYILPMGMTAHAGESLVLELDMTISED
jgi:hypothetical protein